MTSFGQGERLLHAERVVVGVRAVPYSPASLARKLLTPSQAITTPARQVAVGAVGADADDRAGRVAQQAGDGGRRQRASAPAASALPASQWSKSGR